ncbi:hypothetical protein QUA27_07050 [Microcoleus sp. Pol14C6]|uniref:hypothetical protein n=1 Tax=unclassified Microcoleus TaxID=2642155 RepID=UPI002FCF6A65
MFSELWQEGSSATSNVRDVTDVTEVKKGEGRGKRALFSRSISNIPIPLIVRTFLIAETIVFVVECRITNAIQASYRGKPT